MSTGINMSMSSNTLINGSERIDGIKNSLVMNRQASKPTPRNPMRNSITRSTEDKSQDSLIDEALCIINSPQPSVNSTVMGRRGSAMVKRGSLVTPRRHSEMLLDNSDRLSIMMQHCRAAVAELDDSDDESDCEP